MFTSRSSWPFKQIQTAASQPQLLDAHTADCKLWALLSKMQGARDWTCVLHGEQQQRPFPPDFLHVYAPAAAAPGQDPSTESVQADNWVWEFNFDEMAT